jgi:hypothetical protein
MNAESFANALNEKFQDYEFSVEAGIKFDKIVQSSKNRLNGYSNRSVHAFVERSSGDLIKAAGWKAPAKIKSGWATRYNLITEFDKAVEEADQFGGYLYQR